MGGLISELEAMPKDDSLRHASCDLTDRWRARGIGLEGVEAVLFFIEAHPDLDHGAPGALVHFAEEHRRRGYEAALLRSLSRRPTALTAWMANRLINGAEDALERAACVDAFERAEADPTTDDATRAEIARHLERIRREYGGDASPA